MAAVQIGAPGLTLVKTTRDYDPANGYVYVVTYEGNEATVYGVAASLEHAGVKTRVDHDGPAYTLEIRTGAPQNGQQETPVDKWNIDIDFVQDPIWSAPAIIEAAGAAAPAPATADDVIAYWRQLIKDKQEAAVSVAASGFAEPLKQIYANIIRGQEAYETERPVLTRVRTFSFSYADQVVLDAVPKVYTTNALKFYFGIPGAVASRLPADPDYTPPYTRWAWKKRKDTSEVILALNKIQETKDWVFAAWDTLTYDVIDY